MAKKYSQRFEEDYHFYWRNVERFKFSGKKPADVVSDPNGKDAKHCFHVMDSQGKRLPCSEPEKLKALLMCKASINWHIKQWVEGYLDGTFPPPEMRKYFDEIQAPDWVEKAVTGQAIKKMKSTV